MLHRCGVRLEFWSFLWRVQYVFLCVYCTCKAEVSFSYCTELTHRIDLVAYSANTISFISTRKGIQYCNVYIILQFLFLWYWLIFLSISYQLKTALSFKERLIPKIMDNCNHENYHNNNITTTCTTTTVLIIMTIMYSNLHFFCKSKFLGGSSSLEMSWWLCYGCFYLVKTFTEFCDINKFFYLLLGSFL